MASSIGPLHPSPQYPQGMPAPPHHTSPPPHQPYPQPHHGLHVPPSSYGNSYNMAYDPQQSQSSTATMPSYSHSFPNSQQPSFSNGPVSSTGAGYSRSFGQQRYPAPRQYEDSTQIYTAVYSGVSVYEMEVHGIACMRRRSDGWLNATQILKVAGVDKGKRTKVLEKEVLTGEHEKVQGGYGKYQGTWISYRRGREFCRQYGVEDMLKPLLDYDVSADGSKGEGQTDTPTKEQAMAANRKRFYNTAVESQRGGPLSNGTFFQNISPTTSVALAAMNKAARLNSPGPQRAGVRSASQQDNGFVPGSQQSMVSEGSFGGERKHDAGWENAQVNGSEPPRKRMRPDSRDGTFPVDASMRSVTPTEPNESFYFDSSMPQEMANGTGEPVAMPPLPNPTSDSQHDKMGMVLDLFAEAGRTDYANHPALTQLSGEELCMPLDASANNALHWAATLAKVPLLKLLIQKGANIYRGNAAGQSPLISAVLVNNCWEQTCFSELLDVLGPLIEVRDLQGRTILHHIAVSSGIKGRAPSSKYYLEALLEFLVRIGTHPGSASGSAAQVAATAVANMQANGDALMTSSQDSSGLIQSSKGAVSLVRFLSHIVNARDKAGNTALNLVARIGNQSIIKQLIEIHADPTLPNNKGVSAKDFGVGEHREHSRINGGLAGTQQSTQSLGSATLPSATQETNVGDADISMISTSGSQVEDLGQDVITSMTEMLTQSMTTHKELLTRRTEQIDALNAQIQEYSALQKQELEQVNEIKERVRLRDERQARIANLRRCINDKRLQHELQADQKPSAGTESDAQMNPPWLTADTVTLFSTSPSSSPIDADALPTAAQREAVSSLPSTATLKAHLDASQAHVADLRARAEELKSRSGELENLYRKVVSLCTGVEEEKVEESLPSLVAAVESEKAAPGGNGMGGVEVGRVREFLRRVDGT